MMAERGGKRSDRPKPLLHQGVRLSRLSVKLTAATIILAGCGAAYYGAVVGFIVTSEETNVVDTSFPDGVPTAPVNPGFATLVVTAADPNDQITVLRTVGGGFPAKGAIGQTQNVIDYQVTAVNFPEGYGEAQSNRDADINLLDGSTPGTQADRIVVRINGDNAQEIVIGGSDVASIGTQVAAVLQSRVRALGVLNTTATPPISPDAYNLFTATFDPSTKSYTFVSGAPGPASAVVFEPDFQASDGNIQSDSQSQATAARLGLGIANGGIEISGAESVRVTIINRGTDVIPAGTQVELYLSHDKVLDETEDILFDRVSIPDTVAVGEARLVTRTNGNPLPDTLVLSDFEDESYFILYDLDSSGGEQAADLANNVTNSLIPVEIYRPLDDPSTTAVEVANALDFALTRTGSPIAVVAGELLATNLTMTNLGLAVPAGGVPIDIDMVLSSDQTFDVPAQVVDPNAVVAGVNINPSNPSTPITVIIQDDGTDPLAAVALIDTITVSFSSGAATVATVQSMIDALNDSTQSKGLVDAFADGNGNEATDALSTLFTAAGGNPSNAVQVTAKDIFVTSRRVTYPQTTSPQQPVNYSLNGILRDGILKTQLPLKLFPMFRIQPRFTAPADPDNVNNNIRQAANFVRVYDPDTAAFDAATSTLLPTKLDTDFAALDAVTLRPVNTGSIRQGQQRVFSFEIPATGVTNDESQLLVVLRTQNFDAHLDLLSGNGNFITGSDDSGLGSSPIIYTAVNATGTNHTFYLVVSPARFDESDLSGGGETFELTISVNAKSVGDPGLVAAVNAGNEVTQINTRYEVNAPRIENKVLIPFSLSNTRAEIMFVLPRRARVTFKSTPVFSIGVQVVITEFLEGQVPSPVEFQTQLDVTATSIVYRPPAGDVNTSHELEAGVYTFALDGLGGQADTQDLRLEIEAEFIPPDTTTTTGN